MRKDFVHLYSETGYKSHRGRSNPNPRVQIFRNQKPRLTDLVYDEEFDEYDIEQERNIFKHSKTSPVGTLEWGDGKYYRYRMINRFLQSQVGKNWNDVYSDVCKNSPENIHLQNLKETLNRNFYVEKNTLMKDGKVHKISYDGSIVPILPDCSYRSFRYNDFYVHPETGNLCSTWNDYQKTVSPHSRELNKIFLKERMIQKKKLKREKKLRIGQFTRLNWCSSKTNTTFEDAMRILKEKKSEGK